MNFLDLITTGAGLLVLASKPKPKPAEEPAGTVALPSIPSLARTSEGYRPVTTTRPATRPGGAITGVRPGPQPVTDYREPPFVSPPPPPTFDPIWRTPTWDPRGPGWIFGDPVTPVHP